MDEIVVGVDGSGNAADALRWAAALAARRGWSVTALLAWDTLDQHFPDRERRYRSDYGQGDADEALEAYVVDALGADAARAVRRVAPVGAPAPLLIEASADAALLVLGPRGMGAGLTAVLGSVSLSCTQWSTCPVAIVHDAGDGPHLDLRRIVAGVDGSGASRRALQWAVDVARATGAELDVVHAWHPPYLGARPYMVTLAATDEMVRAGRQALDRAIDSVDPRGVELPIERILVEGGAAQALLDTAKGADLLVVGTRGRGGFAGLLLGSVSQQLMHHAGCPVVVVVPSAQDG
jgi:nucleotide-binding universal stress UspA family protein